MMLKAVQIRVLLGRGGETIKSICSCPRIEYRVSNREPEEERTEVVLTCNGCSGEKANAEIKVDHDRIADEGASMQPKAVRHRHQAALAQGKVTIVGEREKAEVIIRETLAAKGLSGAG